MPTARAWVVTLAALAAYGGALVWHYPELGVLAAAGLVAVVLTALWMLRRPTVEARRSIEPQQVQRGQLALAELAVRNPGRHALTSSYAIDRVGEQQLLVDLPRMRPGAARSLTYPLPTDRRALIELPPTRIIRQDPLGLFRHVVDVGAPARLCVYPVIHPLGGIPLGLTRSLDGPDSARVPHGSITFHSLRDYVVGDDWRHVHWKASARVGQLMVREHIDASITQVTVILDNDQRRLTPERFEIAAEVAASIVSVATRERYPVRLLTADGRSATSRGGRARPQSLLELLASVQLAESGSLDETVARLSIGRGRDLVTIVTGELTQTEAAGTFTRLRRFDRVGIVYVTAAGSDHSPSVPRNGFAISGSTAEEVVARWNVVARR